MRIKRFKKNKMRVEFLRIFLNESRLEIENGSSSWKNVRKKNSKCLNYLNDNSNVMNFA